MRISVSTLGDQLQVERQRVGRYVADDREGMAAEPVPEIHGLHGERPLRQCRSDEVTGLRGVLGGVAEAMTGAGLNKAVDGDRATA